MENTFRLPSTTIMQLFSTVKQDNVFVLPESVITAPTSQIQSKSYLGTPIIQYLQIDAGTYKTASGEFKSYEGLFIDAVVMTVSQKKNIVKTPVFGRSGTFKEYIADGDFDVNIQGVLHNSARQAPDVAIQILRQICEAPASMRVASPFLEMFDIWDLVIENYSFSQEKAGKVNVQMFELSCVSDLPFELVKE
jgi:hypothetical protein